VVWVAAPGSIKVIQDNGGDENFFPRRRNLAGKNNKAAVLLALGPVTALA